MRLSRTSFFTDRRGNASGDAARARRRSPSVLMVEIDGMPDSIPARIARCIRRFVLRGPLVFAHRGGSKIGPENTIAAFDRGLAARRRRPGARRPPLPRRHCRRPSRRHARSHHARNGAAQRPYGRRARRIRCAAAPSRARPLPEDRHHHRAERARPRARRGGCRRGAPRRRERSRVPRIVQPVRSARGARCRARHCDQRRSVRSADGAVSIVVRPVTGPRAVPGVSGSRNQRQHAGRLADDSCGSRTKPASRCRCGRWTSPRTFGDCWIGASTASFQTGRTLPLRWSRTGSVGKSTVDGD